MGAFYHRSMSEVLEQETKELVGHSSKYTRNNPYSSTVRVNELQTAAGSEKETRHIELTLDEGMTYTPGDAVGFIVARVDGTLPDGLELPRGAVMLDGQGEIVLFWPDTGTDFLALLSVTPVDRLGTRGTARTALVESIHPPRQIRLVVGVIGMVLTFLGGAAFGAIAMKKRRPSA